MNTGSESRLPNHLADQPLLHREVLSRHTATRTRGSGVTNKPSNGHVQHGKRPTPTDTDIPLSGCPSAWRGRPRETSKLFATSALVSPNGTSWSISPLNSGDRPLQRRRLTPTTHSRACAGARGIDFSPNQTSYLSSAFTGCIIRWIKIHMNVSCYC